MNLNNKKFEINEEYENEEKIFLSLLKEINGTIVSSSGKNRISWNEVIEELKNKFLTKEEISQKYNCSLMRVYTKMREIENSLNKSDEYRLIKIKSKKDNKIYYHIIKRSMLDKLIEQKNKL